MSVIVNLLDKDILPVVERLARTEKKWRNSEFVCDSNYYGQYIRKGKSDDYTYFVFLNCAVLYYNMEYEVTSSITIKIITQKETPVKGVSINT
jgi:hypothetical protein